MPFISYFNFGIKKPDLVEVRLFPDGSGLIGASGDPPAD